MIGEAPVDRRSGFLSTHWSMPQRSRRERMERPLFPTFGPHQLATTLLPPTRCPEIADPTIPLRRSDNGVMKAHLGRVVSVVLFSVNLQRASGEHAKYVELLLFCLSPSFVVPTLRGSGSAEAEEEAVRSVSRLVSNSKRAV